MPNYKLSEIAEADLVRIYRWGLQRYGQAQADRYFAAFFDHFDQLAEQPLSHPVAEIREATGAVCVVPIACITESLMALLRSWLSSVHRMQISGCDVLGGSFDVTSNLVNCQLRY